jgi:hypothetical protein
MKLRSGRGREKLEHQLIRAGRLGTDTVRVGSPLLRALAARTWSDVTGGAGVVLVDGKPVKPGKGGAKP